MGTGLDDSVIATVRREAPLGETLATRFDPRANNFDLVRIILAIVVVFCHCFSLNGSHSEPIGDILHYGYGGTLAVYGFLVISGFLVTRSLCDRSLDDYVFSRIVRIIPALALITLVEVFVIGPIFSEANWWVFLTYVGFRHLWNVTVFGLDSQMYSVFRHTNPPWLMNGSLWTIPIECSFYVLLPILTLAVGLRRSIGLLFLLSLGGQVIARRAGLSYEAPGESLFTNVHVYPFVDLASYFLAGSAAWIARDRIPFNVGALALSLIGLYAAAGVALSDLALKLFLPYLVLYISLAGELGSRLKRLLGDLSYGTYLFGFPVTLCVLAASGQHISTAALFAVTIAITLACAWLSWRFVERPCLRLKPTMPRRPG